MKILLVNDYATPTAGCEIMLLMTRDGLRALGHEVRVFASRAALIPGESFADYTCSGSTTRLQAVSSAMNPSAYFALRKALKDFQPDLVHVHMFLWQLSPAILPLLLNVPAIYHAVTYKAICPTGMKLLPDGSQCEFPAGKACRRNGCLTPQSWAAMMFQQWAWHRNRKVFDAFLAPSDVVRRRLLAAGIGPSEVIPNACFPRQMRPTLSDPPTLAFAGRLSPEKGVDTLLQAFAIVLEAEPQTRLLIAGDGPELQSLMMKALELRVSKSVEFTGALPRDELERRLDGAWVQIVPSIWEEPFGLVAIEAMMRGTAVVASSNGAFREYVEDGVSGFLTPPGDKNSLARKLLHLVRDVNACERVGTAGHHSAMANHTADVYVKRVAFFYARTLAKRASHG